MVTQVSGVTKHTIIDENSIRAQKWNMQMLKCKSVFGMSHKAATRAF